MKTLFITRHLPYPPMGGAALRNWQNINVMLYFGSIGVISIQANNSKDDAKYPDPPEVSLCKNYCVSQIPQKNSGWQKIKNKLWFLQPKTHPWTNKLYSEKVAQELEDVLRKFKPKIIVFEELWLFPYLKRLKKHKCYFIYDTHNIEASLRQQIYGSVRGIKSKIESAFLLTKVKAIESSFVRQVDRVWVCSDDDAALMQKLYGKKSHPQVVPNGINISDYETIKLGNCPLPKNFQITPHTIIFIGAFSYTPNAVAAQILIKQIFPELQKNYSDCHLLLVGREPTKQMKQAAQNNPGITVTGKVTDIRPYLAAASVAVVPLLQGGGTRFKILEAFAAGRPVVSTSKGAEGLTAQDEEHLLIRNTTEDIVAGVSQLWSNSFLRQKLVDSAYELVKAKYSWESVNLKVQKILEHI
ncbi:glycosyltransferase family 4 protein [Myxosarcina sp. GI1]|uniref:glycosyltransferase family 4 protein n=1 Tax=Myxosarcina sp. GI1 TaxID=1541065 RepID=UPI00056359AE|nr:glycosyltransferase family 4 protein [Myxosarcina sp. GI1]